MDTHPPHQSPPATLDLLPPLTQITRVCTAKEISQVLERLRESLSSEQRRFVDWDLQADQQRGLIATAEATALRSIHEELNRIELERFIVAGSVANLHQSCTHYRDLLAERALEIVQMRWWMPARQLRRSPLP